MKRRQEFDGGDGQAAKRQGGPRGGPPLPCALKFLTPEALASAVIGKGGSVIAAMRQAAQASIGLTDKHDFFPGTDCRVLTAQAHTEAALAEVSRQIIAKVVECVQAGPSEQLGQPGDIKIKTLVPRAAVGGIIGKGGAAIKSLREQSGAKISIGDPSGPGLGAEQIVSISGSPSAAEQVMLEVNRQIQALNSEDWFQSWVSGASAAGSARNSGAGYYGWQGDGYGGNQSAQGYPSAGVGSAVGYAQSGGGGGAGVELLNSISQSLPQYVMEDARGFALSCVVPNRLVGGLIGRGGAGTKEVQSITGTKIGIREIPGDSENRSMNIAGPLANTCAAYMLMMKRYLDSEAQAAQQAE